MRDKRTYWLRQQKLCDDWNDKHLIGTQVNLVMDDGSLFRTQTRSPAHTLSSGKAVIWVEGKLGCWALERAEVVRG